MIQKLTKEQKAEIMHSLHPETEHDKNRKIMANVEHYRARFMDNGHRGLINKKESIRHILTMWIEDEDYDKFLKHYYYFIKELEKDLTDESNGDNG